MYSKALLPILASLPIALGATLAEVLSSNHDLSTLNTIVGQFPALTANLSGTLFAPTNEALERFIASAGGLNALTPADITNVLTYHVVPAVVRSTDVTKPGGAIAPTALNNWTYANLDGSANVIFASAYGSTGVENQSSGLKVYSGVGEPATVTQGDIDFDGGVVHIIDQ